MSFLKAFTVGSCLFAVALGTALITHVPKPPLVTLTPGNTASIVGEVNGDSVIKAFADISKSDPSKVLYLYLDTPGGSVFAGKALVDYLSTTKRNIHCIANVAISMGFHILESGCKVRLVTPQAILMAHEMATQIDGKTSELEFQAKLTRKLEDLFDTASANRLGLSLKSYQSRLTPEWWLMGDLEVLKANAADTTVTVNCSIELEKSGKCPLIPNPTPPGQ